MIRRLLCRWFGHPPIRFGSIYGACHRCGALVRPRPQLPPIKLRTKTSFWFGDDR